MRNGRVSFRRRGTGSCANICESAVAAGVVSSCCRLKPLPYIAITCSRQPMQLCSCLLLSHNERNTSGALEGRTNSCKNLKVPSFSIKTISDKPGVVVVGISSCGDFLHTTATSAAAATPTTASSATHLALWRAEPKESIIKMPSFHSLEFGTICARLVDLFIYLF